MQAQKKTFGQEEMCKAEAEREQKFTARSLLEELEPLLKEYFYGEFRLETEAITAQFLNGQTFRIIVQ